MSDTVARVTPAQRWTLPRGEIVVRARQADPRRDVEAAVFVHGLGGSTLNWVSLVAELDDDLDWVSVDLPGFGGSPPPRDGDYSPRGHARAVIGVIEEVQRRRGLSAPIHLVGNSLGGAVALQVTAARPDLVAGLTLVSPALPNLTLGRGNAHLPVVALPGVGESLVGRYARVPAAQRVAATLEACTVDDQRVRRTFGRHSSRRPSRETSCRMPTTPSFRPCAGYLRRTPIAGRAGRGAWHGRCASPFWRSMARTTYSSMPAVRHERHVSSLMPKWCSSTTVAMWRRWSIPLSWLICG